MIRSMTAFVRQEIKSANWTATWEIRSLNQRYLEIQIYLPDTLRTLEQDIRKQIKNINDINRGRIECKLHINIENNNLILNTKLIDNLIKLIKSIPNKNNMGKIDPIKILSWPGVMITEKVNTQTTYKKLLQEFNNTLHKLIRIRENEGIDIEKIIIQRLFKINKTIDKIEKKLPCTILNQRNKLIKKIQETNIDINNLRLEEELIIYAQKSDISEEIDRLKIHIKNIKHILRNEKIVGRKLDFIIQELYREINTLASKSTNIKIIESSIEIKILIEQIREQIQNVE